MMCKTNKKYKTKTKKVQCTLSGLAVGEIERVQNWGDLHDRNACLFSINDARIVYYLPVVWKYLLFEKVTVSKVDLF